MNAPSRRLPFLLRRLQEDWAFRRQASAASTELDELRVRIAYANLRSALGGTRSARTLRRLARESRRVLRRTEFETAHPVLWTGFTMAGVEHLERALVGKGAIVVSGHVGPYRFIPIELAQRGHHVDVVVDRRGIDRETGVLAVQGRLARELVDADGRVGHWRANLLGRLGMINAEASDVAVRMVRALRAGHVLMVYVDGNTGAGARKAEHLERVPFMGTDVLLRQGIGEIAKVSGAPVVPAFAWRRPLRRHLCRFHPAITPSPAESRAAFSTRMLRDVMALFEARLADSPGAWEEWHHFHRMRDDAPPTTPPTPDAPMVPVTPAATWSVDSYRAFGVSDGATHFVFEPEHHRFVKVSKLGVDLVRALYRPRSLHELVQLFERKYGPGVIADELQRLAARGWLERSA
jgi:lauroyl/myristoyl acyltransferase